MAEKRYAFSDISEPLVAALMEMAGNPQGVIALTLIARIDEPVKLVVEQFAMVGEGTETIIKNYTIVPAESKNG